MILVGDSGKLHDVREDEIRTGITSNVGNKHIPIIDYDDLPIDEIKKDLIGIRRKYRLSSFYIFRTSRGRYTALCFKPVSWKSYRWILFTANCCVNFRHYTIKCKKGTMRIDPKPDKKSNLTLITTLKPKYVNKRLEKEEAGLKEAVMGMIERSGGRT